MAKTSKQLLIAAAIIVCVVVMALYVLWQYRSMGYRRHSRVIAQDCQAALEEMQKSPPGAARLDQFIARLKAIDTSGAPDEVKGALDDYVAAIEKATAAFKAGGDTTADERTAEEKKDMLVSVLIDNEQRHWIP